jgi:hypothetical protein
MTFKSLTSSSMLLALVLATSAFAAEPAVTIIPPLEGAKIAAAQISSADGKAVIHLVYTKDAAPVYATSTDNGKTISTLVPVLKSKPTVAGLVFDVWDMTVSEAGKVFVAMGNNAWKLKLPKDRWGMFMATLEPGAKDFSPTINLNGTPSEGFSIAAAGNSVTAAFLSGKLFWKQSNDGGKTFSPNQEINPAILPCECCTTSLAVAKDGTLALLYRDNTNNNRDMFVVLYKNGKQSRTRISQTLWNINACPMTYYKIVPTMTGDGFVAAWPTKGEAYFTRITTTGEIWPAGEIKVGGKTGMRSSVFALAGANDSTLIAWKDGETLHYRIYDSSGKPTTDELTAPGSGSLAAGITTQSGDFLLFP